MLFDLLGWESYRDFNVDIVMYTEADGRKKRDELEIAERKERRRH